MRTTGSMFGTKMFKINQRSKAIYYLPTSKRAAITSQILAPTVEMTLNKQKATQVRWLPRQAASMSLAQLAEMPEPDYATEIRIKAHDSLSKLQTRVRDYKKAESEHRKQQMQIKPQTKLMIEVEQARRKMYEYQAAKERASASNPYITMPQEKLVEKMLAPVDDVKALFEQSKSQDLADASVVKNAAENYSQFKTPYYQESFEHTLLKLKHIDKQSWETQTLIHAKNYARQKDKANKSRD